MILCVRSCFRGSYCCYYDFPDHIEYIKNSDINQMRPYEVKMLVYRFMQNSGLNPEKLDFSKSVRDLIRSANSCLKSEKLYSRIKFL